MMQSLKSPQQGQPSRQQVFTWIHSLLSDVPLSLKVEDLGKGTIYCRILHHYFPGIISINRIIWTPKSEYENLLNLRIFHNAVVQLKLPLAFDPVKLSKEKLADNWAFLVAFYRQLVAQEESIRPQEEMKFNNPYYTPFSLPKRPIQHLYPEQLFSSGTRQPFHPLDNFYNCRTPYNSSKYSVGKLHKDPMLPTGSPSKGKWSVNSHMFQSNLVPIIDRVKEILLKTSHDTEKIRQIKMLLNIPLNEDVAIKIEDDEINPIIKVGEVEVQTATTIINPMKEPHQQ